MLTALLALALQQPQYTELHRQWPELEVGTADFAFGDIDGDGDVDAVVAQLEQLLFDLTSGPVRVIRNEGARGFRADPAQLGELGADSTAVELADFDGDGDLDLLTAGTTDSLRLYANDGSGTFNFQAGALLTAPNAFIGLGVGDLDGDGDLDGVAAGNTSAVFFNSGAGIFSAGPQFSTTGGRRALVFDRDGDGDLDLFIAAAPVPGAANMLYDNSGGGVFADVGAQLPAGAGSGIAADAGDVDGDGDIDIALSARTLLNDGSGAFSLGADYPVFGSGSGVALRDVNGDGDLDLVDTVRGVLLGNGTGSFSPGPDPFASLAGQGGPIGVADLDGDGDLDLLAGRTTPAFQPVTHSAADRLFLNSGSAEFIDATLLDPRVPARQAFGQAAAIGDLDGDGDLDAFVANFDLIQASGVRRGSLYLNEGFGRFEDGTSALPFDGDALDAAGLADVENDGDLDIFVGGLDFSSVSGGVSYYTNSGAGDFSGSAPALVASSLNYMTFALGDLDADGDVDAVIGVEASEVPLAGGAVARGDGNGGFSVSPSGLGIQDQRAADIELADFDGDGDLDAFFANRGSLGPFTTSPSTGQDELFLNDGAGALTLAIGALPVPAMDTETFRSAAGDVDDDGDIDLAVVTPLGLQTFRNGGSGTFTALQTLPVAFPADIVFTDADLDGDLDLLLPGQLLRNDASGVYTSDTLALPADFSGVFGFGLGDFDGDGDTDAFLAAGGLAQATLSVPGAVGTDRLWVNHARHLAWLNPPVVGRALTLELCSEQPAVTSLWYSTQLLPIALPPAGTVWLDTSRGAQLELLGPASGCTERSYVIPALPQIVGVELYLQSVRAVVPTLELQLSNLEPFTPLGG